MVLGLHQLMTHLLRQVASPVINQPHNISDLLPKITSHNLDLEEVITWRQIQRLGQ